VVVLVLVVVLVVERLWWWWQCKWSWLCNGVCCASYICLVFVCALAVALSGATIIVYLGVIFFGSQTVGGGGA
jgi:hypothetical protein